MPPLGPRHCLIRQNNFQFSICKTTRGGFYLNLVRGGESYQKKISKVHLATAHSNDKAVMTLAIRESENTKEEKENKEKELLTTNILTNREREREREGERERERTGKFFFVNFAIWVCWGCHG